jgi:hypothetical protein
MVLGLELGAFTLATPPALFFVKNFFKTVLRIICPGWLQIAILLISVSLVARITGLSCWCLAFQSLILNSSYFVTVKLSHKSSIKISHVLQLSFSNACRKRN